MVVGQQLSIDSYDAMESSTIQAEAKPAQVQFPMFSPKPRIQNTSKSPHPRTTKAALQTKKRSFFKSNYQR